MARGGALVFAVAAALLPLDAGAVPVFARRYKTSCSTCHTQYPHLNAFGEAFRRNGWQFPAGGDAEAIQETPLKVVSDARRALWPNSFWPSEIPAVIPLSLVIDSVIPIVPEPAPGQETISFDRLYASATLIAAARFGKDVGLWASIFVDSSGAVQLGRGVLAFSNLWRDGKLHLRIGQFEPQVLSFSNYRRIGGPPYGMISGRVRGSAWNFNAFRGIAFSGTIRGRVGWDVAYGQGVEGFGFVDSWKQVPRDGYAHIYFKIGGLRLDGIDNAPEVERSVTIGVFAYGGKHTVDADGNAMTPLEGDVLVKAGGDLYAVIGTVEILAAAAWEKHYYQMSRPTARTQTLLELSWRVVPWVALVARGELEVVGSELELGARITPIISFHPRINLKIQLWAQVEKRVFQNQFQFAEIDIVGRYAF